MWCEGESGNTIPRDFDTGVRPRVSTLITQRSYDMLGEASVGYQPGRDIIISIIIIILILIFIIFKQWHFAFSHTCRNRVVLFAGPWAVNIAVSAEWSLQAT